MYKICRYNPKTHEDIHDFKYISESDLVFLMINHGHTVYFEFLKNMRENPYSWGSVYRTENEVAVVLWSE